MREIRPRNRRDLRRRNRDDFWDVACWMDGFFDAPFEGFSRKKASAFKLDVQDLTIRIEGKQTCLG